MVKRGLKKAWQITGAAISYTLFGLGALIVGLVFRLISVIPGIPAATRQTWIRNCIHAGCRGFILTLRAFGLIRYQFALNSMMQASGGHLVIANHPTLIDVVLLFAVRKNFCCIVKGELWHNMFTSAVVRQAGFIPNHSAELIPLAVEKLAAGENLIIFPEGTRTETSDIIRFKRGASNVAVASGAPIVPVLIKCNPGALKKGDKWYTIPDEGLCYTLTSGKRLHLNELIDTTKPKTLQYRELTRFLEHYYKDWMA
ncbi:lysophospholipid acyltransferase family protein [Alteromonas halophila]|nr:lysophospholipid acyltransferase family protein [Alteromonas halophila]